MKKIALIILVFCTCVSANWVQADSLRTKPRVIVMTDGEIDDRSSMVRFLLYTNDIELLAIIETSSVYQRSGWSKDKWIQAQIDAYEQVYPNLVVHDPTYPTADELRNKLYIGDEDPDHLVVDRNSPRRLPGMDPVIDPAGWPDTPGSDKIVEILLESDPRPVHLQAWGGGNTAARAFHKLKTHYPGEYERAISKVVMYHIWYQDGAGHYIERHHPGVTMLLCHYFAGTWNYGSQRYTYRLVDERIKNNHGPLGALYPQDYISEGDSPAFLHSIANGLRSHEDPTYGGWGGRFYKVYGNIYRDVSKASYWQWIEYANRDFEARMKWCVSRKFEEGNHAPLIRLSVPEDLTLRSGETVELEADISDPDGQQCSVLWWQYKEAGTYESMIHISDTRERKIRFVAPVVTRPSTIHLIVEATDRGTPALTAFRRIILTVLPAQ